MYFLTIPFSFSASNIRPNDMISGMPAMSAISGMAHNVERLLRDQLEVPSLVGAAFSLVYFSLDRDIAPPRRPPEGLDGGSDMKLPGLMDIRRAHGDAMLVVNFEIPDGNDMDRFAKLVIEQDGLSQIESILSARLRFAGGEMFIGLPGEFGNSPLSLGVHQEWEGVLSQMLKAYPTQGLLIQDMSHLVSKAAQDTGASTLDAMADLIYQSRLALKSKFIKASIVGEGENAPGSDDEAPAVEPGDSEPGSAAEDFDDLDLLDLDDDDFSSDEVEQPLVEPAEAEAPYLGVLIPCAVGFHEVCGGHEGLGSYPHVFVEPVLSLVRARAIPSVKRDITKARASWQSHFWRWEHLPQHRLYRAVSFSK